MLSKTSKLYPTVRLQIMRDLYIREWQASAVHPRARRRTTSAPPPPPGATAAAFPAKTRPTHPSLAGALPPAGPRAVCSLLPGGADRLDVRGSARRHGEALSLRAGAQPAGATPASARRCAQPVLLTSRAVLCSQVLENQAMLASLGIMNLVQQQRNQRQPAKKPKERRADVASTSSAAPTRASARVATQPLYFAPVSPQRWGASSRAGECDRFMHVGGSVGVARRVLVRAAASCYPVCMLRFRPPLLPSRFSRSSSRATTTVRRGRAARRAAAVTRPTSAATKATRLRWTRRCTEAPPPAAAAARPRCVRLGWRRGGVVWVEGVCLNSLLCSDAVAPHPCLRRWCRGLRRSPSASRRPRLPRSPRRCLLCGARVARAWSMPRAGARSRACGARP